MNYIDGFVEKLGEVSDAPPMFIRACAYHLLSFYPGRFCISTYGRKLKPNMFFLLSSIPGRGRRSTVANWDNEISEKVFFELEELEDETSEEYKAMKEYYETLIIEDGTPEGISDHLTKYKNKILDIRSSEFGTVLSKMNKDSGYAYGLSAFFSRLYYGERYRQDLSQRKGLPSRKVPPGIYATMFSGMQEPYLYITPEMIREGLLRRITLCYVPIEHLGAWRPPIDPNIQPKSELAINWAVDNLINIFKHFERAPLEKDKVNIVIDDDAAALINAASKRDESNVVEAQSDLTIYLQSTWEQLAKLSMLECIGRKGVLVKKEDVEKAIEFYTPIYNNAETIVNSIGVEKPITLIKRGADRVYALIFKAGEEGITRSALTTKLHMDTTEFDSFIRLLTDQGKIVMCIERRGPNNKSTVIFKRTIITLPH